MAIRMSNAAAKAGIDAALALLGSAGLLRIYTGAAPTNVEDAATGTLLAEIALGNPAFSASTDGTDKATASLSGVPLTDSSANATGTAGYFRLVTSGGTGVIQGSCGTSGANLNLVTTTITATQPVQVTSLTIDLAELGT